MSTATLKLLDQSDYMQANAAIASEIATLETDLRASGKAVPARPAAAAGVDVIAANDALTAHKAMLLGLKSGAVAGTKATGTKGQTLTERVLAAKATNQSPTTEATATQDGETLTQCVLKAKAALPTASELD